jgi:NitT/TauT family transport system ATP-binding protein
LLLDEPFSALDYQTRLKVCDDVQSIIKSENKTALLVTHDISEAIALSDKVIVLSARPAEVINEHMITFGGNSPKQRRECSEFARTFEILRSELGL